MINLSEPNITGLEKDLVNKCLDSGWVSASGNFVSDFEEKISTFCNSKYAIACINGTAGLHIALKLSGVEENTEVIVPTLTFVAPINAVIYNNAEPVFFDVDEYHTLDINKVIKFLNNETYEIENQLYNSKTNKRISGILPVHMWGNTCDMLPLKEYFEQRGLSIPIIEDASESLGSFFKIEEKKIHSGTLGDFGVISFNANKIIDIFKGEDNDFSKAVCLNAAAGLIVSENHNKFIDAYQNAKEHILSGKTYKYLKIIQNV